MNRLLLILVCAVSLLFSAFIYSSSAHAMDCSMHRHGCNSDEMRAYKDCLSDRSYSHGAIWMNNSGDAPTSNGYYSMGVKIPHDATFVDVFIRGSVYSCGKVTNDYQKAVNVKIEGSHSSRFSTVDHTLNRGKGQNARYTWSTKGDSAVVRFDTRGLASSTKHSEGFQTIRVGIYRCFSEDGYSSNGYCGTSWQDITIVRNKIPADWTVRPNTSIVSSVNKPGQTIRWKHEIKNIGSNPADRVVKYSAHNFGDLGSGQVDYRNVRSLVAGGVDDFETSRQISHDDVGKQLCRRTVANPRSSTQSSDIASAESCQFVPYNYSLIPEITAVNGGGDDQYLGDAGGVVPITAKILNEGETKSHPGIEWRITQLKYPSAVSSPPMYSGGNRVSDADPCGFFWGNNACDVINSGSNQQYGYRENRSYEAQGSYKDQEAGSRVCYAISVRRNSSESEAWRHSDLTCLVLTKKPKVQVHGGSVQVGRGFSSGRVSNIQTSLTKQQDRYIGATENDLIERIRRTQRHWYFGGCVHFDFGNSGNALHVSKIPSCHPGQSNPVGGSRGFEGTTVATDQYGVPQFYTDGLNIYRTDGSVMANGGNSGSSSTTTQAAAVFPIENNRWVVVVNSAMTSALSGDNRGRLLYTIVDMSANNGAGAIDAAHKKRDFGINENVLNEAMSIAPRKNSLGEEIGYWIVTSIAGTSKLRVYYVPENWAGGSVQHTDYTVGSVASGGVASFGTINFSADYNMAILATSNSNGIDTVRLLGFDQQSGSFEALSDWSLGQRTYSADFSPDGRWVYVTSLYNNSPDTSSGYGNLYRYKIDGNVRNGMAIKNSLQKLADGHQGTGLGCRNQGDGLIYGGGQVKRGPDGRMYAAIYTCKNIAVVANPDDDNLANIGWNPSGVTLADGSLSTFGLPQTAALLKKDTLPPVAGYTTYGSWGEYSLLGTGMVDSMASGAGLLFGSDSGRQGNWSNMTFTKLRSGADSYGAYSFRRQTLPRVERAFPVKSDTPRASGIHSPAQLANMAGGSGVVTVDNGVSLTISGGDMPRGRWLVVNAPNAHVVISGDIKYQGSSQAEGGPISDIKQIPQIVIIARDITVNGNVERVDSWLVAKRAISTCSDSGSAPELVARYNANSSRLSVDICSRQLKINGPVIAERLFLRRTFGSETPDAFDPVRPSIPAEIINLRPDAYLWANNRTDAKAGYQTTSLTEAPPRY